MSELGKNNIAESFSIVSCKDRKNPNFQVWGAMSDICPPEKTKIATMSFKDWMRRKKK